MGVDTLIWRSIRGRRRRRLPTLDTIADVRERQAADFERIRKDICAAGTDSLAHFGPAYTHEGGLSLQQHPDEFAALCCLLLERRPLGRYLEIGSASGGTCRLLNQYVGFEQIWSLDDGCHPRAIEQERNLATLPHCRRFRGDSHAPAARQFLRASLEGPLDVAFIDGDHSYVGVDADIRLVLPHCRAGALLIFHDTIVCEGVERAWLNTIHKGQIAPLAEFVGAERSLGIGVATVN